MNRFLDANSFKNGSEFMENSSVKETGCKSKRHRKNISPSLYFTFPFHGLPISLNDPVADPGFSPGGGANSQNCYYFSHFCRKLHENERIWTPGGGARPWRPPLDPPMRSVYESQHVWLDVHYLQATSKRRKVSMVGCLSHSSFC